ELLNLARSNLRFAILFCFSLISWHIFLSAPSISKPTLTVVVLLSSLLVVNRSFASNNFVLYSFTQDNGPATVIDKQFLSINLIAPIKSRLNASFFNV